MIPYSRQVIEEDDIAAVEAVLRSDWITQGPNILRFEDAICEYTGAKYGCAVNSATAGLHLACLAMGLYISFAGKVTYKNAQPLREVAARIPLDRLLVETDSPYLAPVPVRGKRNEPAFVVHTAACLANLHGVGEAEIAEHTTRNARGLFRLPEGAGI